MATVLVHRYRVYDISRDEYVTSTRMATEEQIAKIGGEIIPDTGISIDVKFIKDGWTEKDFNPMMHLAQELERRLHEEPVAAPTKDTRSDYNTIRK